MFLDIPTTTIDYGSLDSNMSRLIMETVNNILIELVSMNAQAEIERKQKRVFEGIAAMKARGEYFPCRNLYRCGEFQILYFITLHICSKNARYLFYNRCIIITKGAITMDFMKRMSEVINYIEEHIVEDFDFNELEKIVCCNAHQFGRIFSYMVGISLTEYIRNRRLSLAALELQDGNIKVIDTALKYGYRSPESFARAFREMHGVSPREVRAKGVTLKMYPCIDFQIIIKGVINMDYRIEEVKKGEIKCVGRIYHLAKGDDGWNNAWEKYLDIKDEKLGRTPNEVIRDKYKLYRAPLWQIGIAHNFEDGSTDVSIGAEFKAGEEYPEFDLFEIPAGTWAKFSGKGKVYAGLDALMTKIFAEWLPSSGYEKSMQYTIEIYPPGDSQSDDYAFEIWIPVKKK